MADTVSVSAIFISVVFEGAVCTDNRAIYICETAIGQAVPLSNCASVYYLANARRRITAKSIIR